MIYLGVITILTFNAFMYYDHIQHNNDLFKDKKLAFNITFFIFILVELLLFLCFYTLLITVTGIFND